MSRARLRDEQPPLNEPLLDDSHEQPPSQPAPATGDDAPPLSTLTSLHWPYTSAPRFVPYPVFFTYLFLGVAQALPVTSVSWLMIYDIGMSPAVINTVYNLWFQMGLTRPLWSFVSDQWPVIGYRRRPYLLIATVACLIGTVGMASPDTAPDGNVGAFIGWGLLVYLTWAIAESVTDSIVVELGNQQVMDAIIRLGLTDENNREQKQRRKEYGLDTDSDADSGRGGGSLSSSQSLTRIDKLTLVVKSRLQSECMATRTLSTLIAYGTSIALLKLFSYRDVLLLNVLTFVPVIFAALSISEKKITSVGYYGLTAVHNDGTISDTDTDTRTSTDRRGFLRAKLRQLYQSFRMSILPVTFVFLYYAVPTSSDTYYYYLYSGKYQFAPWQAELNSFLSLIFSLLGTLLYGKFLTKKNLKFLFVLTTVLGFGVDLLKILLTLDYNKALGISASIYIPLIGCLGSLIGGIGNMLPIVLAHHYTPRLTGMEGSMFSIYQCSDRLGVIVSSSLAALMTDRLGIGSQSFDSVWMFILICAALEFLPLLTMSVLLKNKPPPDQIEEKLYYNDSCSDQLSENLAQPLSSSSEVPLTVIGTSSQSSAD